MGQSAFRNFDICYQSLVRIESVDRDDPVHRWPLARTEARCGSRMRLVRPLPKCHPATTPPLYREPKAGVSGTVTGVRGMVPVLKRLKKTCANLTYGKK